MAGSADSLAMPTAPLPAVPSRGPLPVSRLVRLSVYWFGILTIWGGVNNIVLPARLAEIDQRNLGTLLGVANAIALVVAILVQPTIGAISDATVSRWGRRKPYILIGALLDVIFLVGLASSLTFVTLVAFLVLLQFSSNFAQGPFQGYVPDLVPAHQVGLASGLMGFMIVLGQIAGVGIASLGVALHQLWLGTVALGVVEVATMIVLVVSVDEGPPAPVRTRSWWRIGLSAWGTDLLHEANVLWLLLVRLLFLGAVAATNLGTTYFVRAHGLSPENAAGLLFIGTLLVGITTAAAALPGGRLSDRFGRRPLITVACGIAALGMAGVAVAPSPALAIAAFVPFGLGTGIFLSVDWALMTDVIPKATAGRYMGILNAGTAAAGPVFLIVAGFVLDHVGGEQSGDGARAAMATGVAFLIGAAIVLRRVDPRRRER